MFFIYGSTGQVFHGRLEELYQVKNVHHIGRVRAVAQPSDEPLAPEPPPAGPAAEAVRAYRAAIRMDQERGPLYHARQIMAKPVVVVGSDDPVEKAWRTLVERRIHQCPVVDGEERLVGIVGERNLLTALNVDGGRIRDVLARRVGDVMTSPVIAADPLTDIRRIAQAMLDSGVEGVPVVDGEGRIAGFVSRTDILRAVVTDPPLSLWR